MTNWPNIQEYRNFEAKLIDEPKQKVLTDSAGDNDSQTVISDDYKAKSIIDDFLNKQKFQNPESKTVRCVIRKDFEETFKKIEREDGVTFNQESVRPKPQEPVVDRSLDKVRLQNHLKWKKQKEEEYLQKKEAEKIAQQKKKEEELRLEKARKLKEKEREEKLREWQEQKAREKEEKKKEKMVIKKLEEELKVTIPNVDKEKLIEEWVKLKDRQKQIEAEKKAELQRKEEENRALRQSLADLSYRQWKEKVKGRIMTLPKNGYQIFGPKPTPVVKEDWNHNFINVSPRNQGYSIRNTKSNTTNLTFTPAVKELENLSKDLFYLGDLKNRSPSFYNLKASKSGLNLFENSEASSEVNRDSHCEMPLKELQPGIIDLKKNGTKNSKNSFEKKSDFISQNMNPKSEMNFLSSQNGKKLPENYSTDLTCFPSAQGDQNRFVVFPVNKKPSEFLNSLPDAQLLPNKKKIDLYINTCPDNDDDFQAKVEKKQIGKNNDIKIHKERRKETADKKTSNQSLRNTFKERNASQNRIRSLSLQKFEKNTNEIVKTKGKKAFVSENSKFKTGRSQSCEKSLKKITKSESKMKSSLSYKSTAVRSETVDDSRKNLRMVKSKTYCSQKRRSRKPDSEVTASKSEKKLLELDYKNKKRLKRKNALSKSLSFNDSPYCAKNASKSLSKLKSGLRRNAKDAETKSDEGGRSRRLSKAKI